MTAEEIAARRPAAASPSRAAGAGLRSEGSLQLPTQSRRLTALLGDEEQLEEAIERLVAGNEWSIRVKPAGAAHYHGGAQVGAADGGSVVSSSESGDPFGAGGGGGSGAAGTVPARVLTEAAQAFERQLRESVAAAMRVEEAAAAGDASPRPASGHGTGRSRRSRVTGDDGPPGRVLEREGSEAGSATLGFGRRTSIVGAAAAVLKPKPRELTRMFAAALQMSGGEVEEHLMSPQRKDPEEVITRDALKRATKTTLRQMARSRRAAEARQGGGEGAGGGGRTPAPHAPSPESPRRTGTAGAADASDL